MCVSVIASVNVSLEWNRTSLYTYDDNSTGAINQLLHKVVKYAIPSFEDSAGSGDIRKQLKRRN